MQRNKARNFYPYNELPNCRTDCHNISRIIPGGGRRAVLGIRAAMRDSDHSKEWAEVPARPGFTIMPVFLHRVKAGTLVTDSPTIWYSEAMRRFTFTGLLMLLLAAFAFGAPGDSALGDGLFARITTAKGDIVLSLEYQKIPMTVCNFVALAEGKMTAAGGKPFYNGLAFHRGINNFMIQGGDPLGNGTGGPGYKFPDEIDTSLRFDGPGVLAMANAGANTNGSQFFITHVATPWLNGKHTVFGRVVQGQDVVNAIQQGDKMDKITIIRNGAQAAAFKADQATFDALVRNAAATAAAKAKVQRDADIALIEKKYPNATVGPTGLRWVVEKAGTGPKPAPGSTAVVNLKASFLWGVFFDNSDLSGGALQFPVGTGKIIPGLDQSIMDMATGERRTVIVPPELAYGSKGLDYKIPPDSFLVFTIELVRVMVKP